MRLDQPDRLLQRHEVVRLNNSAADPVVPTRKTEPALPIDLLHLPV